MLIQRKEFFGLFVFLSKKTKKNQSANEYINYEGDMRKYMYLPHCANKQAKNTGGINQKLIRLVTYKEYR